MSTHKIHCCKFLYKSIEFYKYVIYNVLCQPIYTKRYYYEFK